VTSFIDSLGKPRNAFIAMALLVGVLGSVNGLDFPLSVPFVERETGHTYLDMCPFCSAETVEANLSGLGERGRLLQAVLLSTIDIVIPVVSLVAGLAVIAALRRRSRDALTRLLLSVPIAAFALDLAENGLIVMLLLGHPSANPEVAGLEGLFSGLKFGAYGAVVLTMLGLGFWRALGGLRRQVAT